MVDTSIKLTPQQIAAIQEAGAEVTHPKAPKPARPLHPAIKRVCVERVLRGAFGHQVARRPTFRNRLMLYTSFSTIIAAQYGTKWRELRLGEVNERPRN